MSNEKKSNKKKENKRREKLKMERKQARRRKKNVETAREEKFLLGKINAIINHINKSPSISIQYKEENVCIVENSRKRKRQKKKKI